jgi:hypothetical protein
VRGAYRHRHIRHSSFRADGMPVVPGSEWQIISLSNVFLEGLGHIPHPVDNDKPFLLT